MWTRTGKRHAPTRRSEASRSPSPSRGVKRCPKCKQVIVVAAIKAFKDRKGTSARKITKFVAQEYKVKPAQVKKMIKKQVARKQLITRTTRTCGTTGLLFIAPKQKKIVKTAPKKKTVVKTAPKKKTAIKTTKMTTRNACGKRVTICAKPVVAKKRIVKKKAIAKKRVCAKPVCAKRMVTRKIVRKAVKIAMKAKVAKVSTKPRTYKLRSKCNTRK